MNEELDQLLKNLKLRRILDIYDEQLRSAEKEDVSYTEFLTRLMCQSPRTLVSGYVSLRSPARRQSQADPHLCRTGVRSQGREHCLYWTNRRREDGIGIRDSAQSASERLSLPVRSRSGSVR